MKTTKTNNPQQRGLRALLLGFVALILCCASPTAFGGEDQTVDPRNAGNRWGAQYFPNVELTTHKGEKVRFFDDLIKDKVVVINFIQVPFIHEIFVPFLRFFLDF